MDDFIKQAIEKERIAKGWTPYKLFKMAYGEQNDAGRRYLIRDDYKATTVTILPLLKALGLTVTKRKTTKRI